MSFVAEQDDNMNACNSEITQPRPEDCGKTPLHLSSSSAHARNQAWVRKDWGDGKEFNGANIASNILNCGARHFNTIDADVPTITTTESDVENDLLNWLSLWWAWKALQHKGALSEDMQLPPDAANKIFNGVLDKLSSEYNIDVIFVSEQN